MQEIALKAEVQLRCRLPLDFLVTHIGELHTYLGVVVAHGVERGAGSIVRDAVVTAHVEACVQAQVVDACRLGEPILVGQHPA